MKKQIITKDKKFILNTYNRYPIILKSAKGVYVEDIDGKKYLDFLSGISVCNLGHSNPTINKAIKNQLDELIHCSNLYYTTNQIELAELISKFSFKGKTFFTNSGTEANEAAIKLIKFRGNKIHKNKNIILSLKGSFHGRSTGSLALTGQDKIKIGLEPHLQGINYVQINNIKDLTEKFNSQVAGMIIEVIQGENGINPLNFDFVKTCRKLCNEHKALLIIDEIQSGLGRSGRFLCYEHYLIKPDGFTLAKSLANGLPIGAFHINELYSEFLPQGKHGSTLGGNPLATRAGIEVIKFLQNGLINKVNDISKELFKAINQLKNKYSFVKEIRGKGLMIGIETDIDANQILNSCHTEGLLLNIIKNNIIRLLPPLIIKEKEVQLFYDKMNHVLSQF